MLAEEIILAPVVTEKSNDELQAGKYTFKVNKKATKIEIKNAVEKLFEVKVLKVNTMTVKGKEKRVGRYTGKTSDWKKAIVTIDTAASEKTYTAKVERKQNFLRSIRTASTNSWELSLYKRRLTTLNIIKIFSIYNMYNFKNFYSFAL